MAEAEHMPSSYDVALGVLIDFVETLRPGRADDVNQAEARVQAAVLTLQRDPQLADKVGTALWALLAIEHQASLYAELGVRSALGFNLELSQRIGARLLPRIPVEGQLRDALGQIFHAAGDHIWVVGVGDAAWLSLFAALPPPPEAQRMAALLPLIEAIRILSYRLAGTALDRELLRAEPELEQHESPFLAQNAELLPLLERERNQGHLVFERDFDHLKVLLDQCMEALERVRRRATTRGISVRLTYMLARLEQLTRRLILLLDFLSADVRSIPAVALFKALVSGVATRNHVGAFVGENLSLLARNVTDHASRHGEHYIAGDRAAWLSMLYSAAGGGVIIACMAMIKVQLSLLHLPPLTEGILFGVNYALGFLFIYMLGFTVATKQPAMTAAALAATLEDSRPRDLDRMLEITRNVGNTQFIAIVGNVALALPIAMLLAWMWPQLFGHAAEPAAKAAKMLAEVHPLHSGALFFAAVAGVGLFLSGIVSGYFDNRARYQGLAARVAGHPLLLRLLGKARAARLGDYMDAHHGAILGNLFFGMYLGLIGSVGVLTGLPVDIRHVAFASANLGNALVVLDFSVPVPVFAWAVLGVIGIASINLLVSFSLALYVAMRSRQLGSGQLLRLGGLMLADYLRNPLRYYLPPPPAVPAEEGAAEAS
ncbi:MAG TPA: preprotein translocase subunit TatB [Rhodocyclaceae bacterium]|nr:preprotein translocase subunit TatB [Rhodocyclaceae bacterium]